MAGSHQKPGELIQGINVTPLVDVVLVLLIVLMVAASHTVSQALPMELPRARTGESQSSSLAISLDHRGRLFVDGEEVTREQLRQAIRSARAAGDVNAMIAADGRSPHRDVVGVIDMIRGEGVTRFAINVAPEDLER